MTEGVARSFSIDRKLWLFVLFIGVEVTLLSLLYKNVLVFDCAAIAYPGICLFFGELPVRAMSVFGILALVALTQPAMILSLFGREDLEWRWVGLHLVGAAIILIPFFFLSNDMTSGALLLALAFWAVGAVIAGIGALFALSSPRALQETLSAMGPAVLIAVIIGLLMPELARLMQEAWLIQPITDFTMYRVADLIRLLGHEPTLDPAERIMGVGDFAVLVGRPCSGIEGIALISAFLFVYWLLFRDELNGPRFLLLWPIGVAISWGLNIVRIAVLILIGAFNSPSLAINGFHSHAGWLMFTIIALGIAIIAHMSPWFRRDAVTVSRAVPLLEDRNAAHILPFIAMMAMILIGSAFFDQPGLYDYPIRVAVVGGVLLLFLAYLRSLDWVLDPLSIGAGLAIGLAWLATAPPPGDETSGTTEALAAMGAVLATGWVLLRIIGTVVIVPLVEELFFRGYVQSKFGTASTAAIVAGILLSTVLFAALHQRWFLAGIAGVVFALLYLRTGRLSDAVIAHAVANATIASAAVLSGDWALI